MKYKTHLLDLIAALSKVAYLCWEESDQQG